MSKLSLQIFNTSLGIIAIALASMSLIYGVDNPIYSKTVLPDLHELYRKLGFMLGMGSGLGTIIVWITP